MSGYLKAGTIALLAILLANHLSVVGNLTGPGA